MKRTMRRIGMETLMKSSRQSLIWRSAMMMMLSNRKKVMKKTARLRMTKMHRHGNYLEIRNLGDAVEKKGNKSQLRESPIRVRWRIQSHIYISSLILKLLETLRGLGCSNNKLTADLEMKLAKRDDSELK